MIPDLLHVTVALTQLAGREPLELWLLGGLALLMLAAVGRAAWTRRSVRAQGGDVDPFLVFPENTVRHSMTPSPLGGGLAWAPPLTENEDEADEPDRPARANPHFTPVAAQLPASSPAQRERSSHAAIVAAAVHGRYPTAPVAPRPAPVAPPRRDEVDEASETIRLPTAADGTVQLLPGMLLMTQGPEVGREFRFLRIGSQPVPEVTMGRATGPPYRHIHLPAVTVSRMHARIRYQDGSWRIANLSTTNPLCLNGYELQPMEERLLGDGDRILLGEVELSYRDQRL